LTDHIEINLLVKRIQLLQVVPIALVLPQSFISK